MIKHSNITDQNLKDMNMTREQYCQMIDKRYPKIEQEPEKPRRSEKEIMWDEKIWR
jgi:hypothetical protein